MVKNLFVVCVWFPATIGLLFVNLMLLISLRTKTDMVQAKSLSSAVPVSASTYKTEQILGASIQAGDARSGLLSDFLYKHNSPMKDLADYIIDRADYYGIDFRMVPSIAMCESGVGKRIPSSDSYNAWGISVATGTTSGAKFPNWMYAIDWVSRYVKEKYYDRGITELVDIGAIWAPPSVEKGNSWANCVQYFMDDIQFITP